jgi:hypothetical protein
VDDIEFVSGIFRKIERVVIVMPKLQRDGPTAAKALAQLQAEKSRRIGLDRKFTGVALRLE